MRFRQEWVGFDELPAEVEVGTVVLELGLGERLPRSRRNARDLLGVDAGHTGRRSCRRCSSRLARCARATSVSSSIARPTAGSLPKRCGWCRRSTTIGLSCTDGMSRACGRIRRASARSTRWSFVAPELRSVAREPEPGTRRSRRRRRRRSTPRFRMSWWWVVFVVGLLAVNFYASSRATQAQSRVRVPYSPYFLNKVNAGDVEGDHVEGNGRPGDVQEGAEVHGRQADDEFPDGDPGVREHGPAVEATAEQGRGREREAAGHRRAAGGRACCSGSARRSCSSGCWCC